MCLVKGSPFDSVRPGQTHCPCLGVKGPQVQILSSRRLYEVCCYWRLSQVSGLLIPCGGRIVDLGGAGMGTICGHREAFEGLLAPGHGALYPGR